jgi:hypothetical protein
MGFETADDTRPRLIAAVRDAVRDRTITLRGRLVIEQCRAFAALQDGTIGGADGADDDCAYPRRWRHTAWSLRRNRNLT